MSGNAVLDEVTCSVCLDLLTDPRLLSCSHSFCFKCLESIHTASKDKKGIICPTCRHVTTAELAKLPRNNPLANIADALRKKRKVQEPSEVSEHEIRQLLTSDKPAIDHMQAQKQFPSAYSATLLLMLESKVALPATSKPRILAACWALRNYELPEILFKKYEFGVPDVVRAIEILDHARLVRAMTTRLEKLKQNNTRASIVNKLRGELTNARDQESCGSLSGAARKHIRRFVADISAEQLEFFLLHFPTKPWQRLADVLHLSPNDFKLKWFLPCVYGADPPATEGGLLAACMRLTEENVDETLRNHQVPYSFLRKKIAPSSLSNTTRELIAKQTTLHFLLWYYEELNCSALDDIICERFKAGDDPDLGFGKLVELLITTIKAASPVREYLIPYAEKVRSSIKLEIQSPVLIIGDASSSMSVAVRTATIIAGFVASLCPPGAADLRFFNSGLLPAPYVPVDLKGVLDVAGKVKAQGMTTNAAGLYDKYVAKEVYKTILMVTDEEENGVVRIPNKDPKKAGTVPVNFGQLYQRYRDEVCPAKLVFVSFLRQTDPGRMVSQLRRERVEVEQLRFDPRKPDLTKLDSLIGMLASESDSFDKLLKEKVASVEKSDNNNDSSASTSTTSTQK